MFLEIEVEWGNFIINFNHVRNVQFEKSVPSIFIYFEGEQSIYISGAQADIVYASIQNFLKKVLRNV